MATSGNIYGTTSTSYATSRIYWSASDNATGNYSVVKATLYITKASGSGTTHGTWNGTIYINGVATTISEYKTISAGSTTAIGNASVKVYHNADGSKSCRISSTGGISGTTISSISCSGTASLTTFNRVSVPTVSPTSVNFGSPVTISTNRASSSLTHTLKYSFSGASGTIATGVGASYVWTVPTSLAKQIPSSTSGKATITCYTYSGSTLVGSKSVSLGLTLSSTAIPTISNFSVTDNNGYYAKYGSYIQGKSVPIVTINASGIYGSTIKTYYVTYQGTTSSQTSDTFNLGVVTSLGVVGVSGSVIDTRNRSSNTEGTSITSIAYSVPIASLSAVRDSDTTMLINLQATITPLNNKNSKSVLLQYKAKTSSTWITVQQWSAYNVNESVSVDIQSNLAYDVRLTVTDDFTTSKPLVLTDSVGVAFIYEELNDSDKTNVVLSKINNFGEDCDDIMVSRTNERFIPQEITPNNSSTTNWSFNGDLQLWQSTISLSGYNDITITSIALSVEDLINGNVLSDYYTFNATNNTLAIYALSEPTSNVELNIIYYNEEVFE